MFNFKNNDHFHTIES
jgi:hypothetical protein